MPSSNKTPFTVIYDGDCGFCMRSLRILKKTDVLKKFTYLDFHNEAIIESRFPSLKGSDFENAMYVVDPQGGTFRGFFGFRRIAWGSPLLWILLPVFYFPLASVVGPRVYAWIARNRGRLSKQACKLE